MFSAGNSGKTVMAFYLHLSHRSTNVIINSEQIALYSIVSTVKHDRKFILWLKIYAIISQQIYTKIKVLKYNLQYNIINLIL